MRPQKRSPKTTGLEPIEIFPMRVWSIPPFKIAGNGSFLKVNISSRAKEHHHPFDLGNGALFILLRNQAAVHNIWSPAESCSK